MKTRTALVVVEKNFLHVHVGVRRVTGHVIDQLDTLGFEVTLAYEKDGKLFDITEQTLRSENVSWFANTEDRLFWDSTKLVKLRIHNFRNRSKATQVFEGYEINSPRKFDITFITNPWLITHDFPILPKVVGIVHDVVPNLLALGVLHYPLFVDSYEFAHEHAIGFDYYRKHASEIMFVSRNTETDFHKLFGKAVGQVVIPFSAGEGSDLPASTQPKARILTVNFLDARKNFENGLAALKLVAEKQSFELVIIGRERMPIENVVAGLRSLSTYKHVTVKWYRDASDSLLDSYYASSNALFFPSIYEGLGLPILEAQSRGLPVISSNSSSCGEINLRPELTTDCSDVTGFAIRLAGLLEKPYNQVERVKLAGALNAFLRDRNSISLLSTLH